MALWSAIRRSEQRQRRDLDRASLARRVGVSPSSLYAYLKGRTLLRSTTLDKLLDELKATPVEKRELASLREAVEHADQRDRVIDSPPSGLPKPRQLPPVTRGFAGRASELRTLDALLAEEVPGTPFIAVIHGTAGVGKTTLALYWAHRLKDRYPDGQLHVNLRGFDADQAPDPGQALDGLLQALGAAPESVPCELDAKAALFRSFLAGRRMLLVLDNARSAEFVRPLLPAAGGTLVIVTSRNQMDGLAVREGAHRLALGVLPYRDALALLERRLGAPRLAAEASAADELVELCARLPLALSVSATKVGASLETFVRRTRDVHDRLEALGSHESDLDLRTVFQTSYALLPEPAARLFRLLGLHAGPDIDEYACAVLLDDDVPAARAALGVLASGNLVGEQSGTRFGSHDLLRAFARSLADDTPPEDRRATVSRVLDHYLGAVVHAGRHIQVCRTEDLPWAPPPRQLPPIGDYGEAMAWLTAVLPTLRATVAQAVAEGLDSHAWRLAWASAVFLRRTGRRADRVLIQHAGLTAALRSGSPAVVATSRRLLADALTRVGQIPRALSLLHTSLTTCAELGDTRGVFQARLSLIRTHEAAGAPATALRHAEAAYGLTASLGDSLARADALTCLAKQEQHLNRHTESLHHARRALRLYVRIGYAEGEADILRTIGRAEQQMGRPEEAVARYERSLDLDRLLGDRFWEAHKLQDLAGALEAAGDIGAARLRREEAWAAFDALRHPTADLIRAELDGAGPTGLGPVAPIQNRS
ncbi:ATP-binding protein [Streptomyces soliscabiei]|uniref:ATP-binding protein n=1 Tax=Streptomyces soliscabiei TaxID=588897 RepID=UPI0029B0BC7E|nr:tetratricopeptide repeat protein [Streptomyces sp. NY05-11A]MDX2680347.1 tetratricopeptide repeat protein [Streptomyces sp. NY05-11A]